MPEPKPKFACPACGQRFTWKPELAGRSVRCQCQHKFKAPAPGNGSSSGFGSGSDIGMAGNNRSDDATGVSDPYAINQAADPYGFAEPQEAFDEKQASNAAHDDEDDAFADLHASMPKRKCPRCQNDVSNTANICVACGTNLQTGQSFRQDISTKRDADFKANARGLKATQVGMLLVLLSTLLTVAAVAIGNIAAINDNDALFVMADAADALAGLFGIIGPMVCLAVPKSSGTRAPLYISVGLSLLSLILAFADQDFELLASVCSLIATLSFLVFLEKLAHHLDFHSVHQDAVTVVKMAVGLVICSVSLCIPLVGLVWFVYLIVFFWKYVALLVDLNRCLVQRIRETKRA